MQISQNGLDFIKKHEGLRLSVYQDIAGRDTVGYGHLILPGESFEVITQEEVDALLLSDIGKFSTKIEAALTVTINQNQFDALCSFVFNLGINAFLHSTLLEVLNDGNYSGAAAQFLEWDKYHAGNGELRESDALFARRQDEEHLFVS